MNEKPNVDNLKMHMPEGSLAIPEGGSEQRIANGPILVLLIVLLILIIGGMYWWYTKLQGEPFLPTPTRPTAEQNNEPESTTAEAQTETMQAVSTSDEINAIEADLETTNLDSLDTELQAIESELNAI